MTATTDEAVSAVSARPSGVVRAHEQVRGTRSHQDLPFGCGRCDSRWSGNQTCHCGVCHLTFSGVSTFDAHRQPGHCLHPLFVGLSVVPGRAYECWGTTAEPEAE